MAATRYHHYFAHNFAEHARGFAAAAGGAGFILKEFVDARVQRGETLLGGRPSLLASADAKCVNENTAARSVRRYVQAPSVNNLCSRNVSLTVNSYFKY